MALRSKFVTNAKLRRCAERDPDHIGENTFPASDRQGEHVKMIHEALNSWLINSGNGELMVKGNEFNTGTFGSMTAKAVRRYKTVKDIRNYKHEIDEIVGIKTVSELDQELPPNGGGGGNTNKTLSVIPFTETAPFLIVNDPDDRSKGDLENTTSTPAFPGGARGSLTKMQFENIRQEATFLLESRMMLELNIVTPSASPTAATIMGRTFIRNDSPKGVIEFGFGTPLADSVQASNGFKDANDQVRADMDALFSEQASTTAIIDYRDLRASLHRVSPPFIALTAWVLKGAIGSLQGRRVLLESFSADGSGRTYKAGLIWELFDHFGCDDSDMWRPFPHGTPGQIALWIMQRERHPGHQPFVSKIMMTSTVEGKF